MMGICVDHRKQTMGWTLVNSLNWAYVGKTTAYSSPPGRVNLTLHPLRVLCSWQALVVGIMLVLCLQSLLASNTPAACIRHTDTLLSGTFD